MKLPGFLNLRGIGGQIAALVVVSIVALHIIVTAAFLIHRPDRPGPVKRWRTQPARRGARLLGTAPASERPRLMATSRTPFRTSTSQTSRRRPSPTAGEPDGPDLHGLQRHLGPGYRIFPLAQGDGARRIGIALPDGAMISAKIAANRPRGRSGAAPG